MGRGGVESSPAGSGTQDEGKGSPCSVSLDPCRLLAQNLSWARIKIPQCPSLTGTALWTRPHTLLHTVNTSPFSSDKLLCDPGR